MPHGRPSLPPPDLPLSALPPMPVSPHLAHHNPIPSTTTIENGIAYPFRLRHSCSQQSGSSNSDTDVSSPITRSRKHFSSSSDVRPDSAVLSGPQFRHVSDVDVDEDEDGPAGLALVARLPAAYLARRAEAGLRYSSGSVSLSRHHHNSSSPTSADFPIVPCRPPLRPTVSFGGVSQISYYSSTMSEDLEARSVSLARAEEEEEVEHAASVRKMVSLSNFSLRKARSFACIWPEARKWGRRKG